MERASGLMPRISCLKRRKQFKMNRSSFLEGKGLTSLAKFMRGETIPENDLKIFLDSHESLIRAHLAIGGMLLVSDGVTQAVFAFDKNYPAWRISGLINDIDLSYKKMISRLVLDYEKVPFKHLQVLLFNNKKMLVRLAYDCC